jgi:dihydroorotate dehydrogenase (NAD+) catalytic subunit
VLLASGTAAYGREIRAVSPLQEIGGIVTKAVSVEARAGAAAPRVAEFRGGMLNAVGLANPGMKVVREEELPWLHSNAPGTRVIVNVVGSTVEDFAEVVSYLHESPLDAFELNVSCPNVKKGGADFGSDLIVMRDLVTRSRVSTDRPIFVKLAPTLSNIAHAAQVAVDAGADGITVVNTVPGMLVDTAARKPALGYGTGGVSGPALLPIGILATWKVHHAVSVPIIGVGGVSSADDVLQYILAGASLVAVGTAALRNPRVPRRIVRDLGKWCERRKVEQLSELCGQLEWQ